MQVIPSKKTNKVTKDIPKKAVLGLTILKQISKEECSEKDLALHFGHGKDLSYVSKEVKMLKETNMILVNRRKKSITRRGPPEKIIDLTDNGIMNLLQFLDPDEFFKMMLFIFDTDMGHKLNELSAYDIISEYEQYTLHNSSRIHVLPLNVIKVLDDFKHPEYISKDFIENEFHTLRVVGKSSDILLTELEEKPGLDILTPMCMHGLLIQWYNSDGIITGLSQLGFLLLLYLTYHDTTKPEYSSITQIKHLIENHKHLFPQLFQNWAYLTKIIDENKLITEFVNLCFRDESYHYMLNNEELLRLFASQDTMQKISRHKLRELYNHGIKNLKEWTGKEKCSSSWVSATGELNPTIVKIAASEFTVDNFPFLSNLTDNKKILRIKDPILELARLQHFTTLSQSDFFNDFIYRSFEMYANAEIFRAVDNVISFQFFTLIITKYVGTWDRIIKNNVGDISKEQVVREWYQNWLDEIQKFEIDHLEQIKKISSSG